MLLEDKRPIERFQDMLQQMGAHSLWKYPVRNDKKKKKVNENYKKFQCWNLHERAQMRIKMKKILFGILTPSK